MSVRHQPRAKLSQAKVKAIRRASPVISQRLLALMFSVSTSRISLIRRGLSWKDEP